MSIKARGNSQNCLFWLILVFGSKVFHRLRLVGLIANNYIADVLLRPGKDHYATCWVVEIVFLITKPYQLSMSHRQILSPYDEQTVKCFANKHQYTQLIHGSYTKKIGHYENKHDLDGNNRIAQNVFVKSSPQTDYCWKIWEL